MVYAPTSIRPFLLNFALHTDHLISARRPDLEIINKSKKKKKRSYLTVDFAVPADHRVKMKENEKRDKYMNLARELKKAVEHNSDGNTNCYWRV